MQPRVADPEPAVRPSQTVQSVERAHRVLTTLAGAGTPLTVAQVADRAGLNRTVAHRLLKTLAYVEMVFERSGRFELGHETLSLGHAYLERLPVRRPALFYAVTTGLRAIEDAPLVISVIVPVGRELTIIDQVWSPTSPVGAILDIGTRLSLDRSASGRAFLASCSPGFVENLLGSERLAQIRPLLDRVRATRLAFSRGEVTTGIAAIASAIHDRAGQPIACINVSGTLDDAQLQPDSEIALQVKGAAEWIERHLAPA